MLIKDNEKRFSVISLILPAVSAVLSKVCSVSYGALSSDIMISNSSWAMIRFLPVLLQYAGIAFETFVLAYASAAVICLIISDRRRQAVKIALISTGICLGVSVLYLLYTVLANSMSSSAIAASAITLIIGVAYFAAALAAAFGFAGLFYSAAKKKGAEHASPVVPCICASALMLAVHLADLTFFYVLPFVGNNTVITSDMLAIFRDYLYYIIVYGTLPLIIMLICSLCIEKLCFPERN